MKVMGISLDKDEPPIFKHSLEKKSTYKAVSVASSCQKL